MEIALALIALAIILIVLARRLGARAPLPALDVTRLIVLIFGIMGPIFVVAAITVAIINMRRDASYVEAPGQIIGFVPRPLDHMHAPIVLLDAPGYGEIVITSTTYYSMSQFVVEERVTMYYPPSDPASAFVKNPFDAWAVPVGLGFLGTVFSVIAVVFYRIRD
jgi:hypothetical protein